MGANDLSRSDAQLEKEKKPNGGAKCGSARAEASRNQRKLVVVYLVSN